MFDRRSISHSHFHTKHKQMCVGSFFLFFFFILVNIYIYSYPASIIQALLVKHCTPSQHQSGFKANPSNISAVTLVWNDGIIVMLGLGPNPVTKTS